MSEPMAYYEDGTPVPQDQLLDDIEHLLLDDQALMVYAEFNFDKTWKVGPQGVVIFQNGEPAGLLYPQYSYATFALLLGSSPEQIYG